MSNKYFAIVTTILFIIIVGCGMNLPKPGTGGGQSRGTIEFGHPDVPEGVKCYVCHKNDRLQQEFHLKFSINCDQCHRQTTWMAYDYPHEKWELGNHRKMQCNKCHTEMATYNFDVWQCFGCHHEKSVVVENHKTRGQEDIANCIRCHKGSGKEFIQRL
ncbi:hypothetical protein ACFL6H_05505 [Candidatus Latescibacterota bacterium]